MTSCRLLVNENFKQLSTLTMKLVKYITFAQGLNIKYKKGWIGKVMISQVPQPTFFFRVSWGTLLCHDLHINQLNLDLDLRSQCSRKRTFTFNMGEEILAMLYSFNPNNWCDDNQILIVWIIFPKSWLFSESAYTTRLITRQVPRLT